MILSIGVVNIIKQSVSRDYTVKSIDELDKLHQLINKNVTQILISKPEILEKYDLINYPNLKRVVMLYAYYDNKELQKYDGIIQLSDTQFQILDLINSLKSVAVTSLIEIKNEDLLSTREIEVLKLLVSGLSTKQLSDQLFISVHTVNNHRKSIIKKLGISTISGLTIYAVINKLIDPNKILNSMI